MISEPWDFKNPEGRNIIQGEIIKILSPSCLIFHADVSVKFDDRQAALFMLTSRYDDSLLNNGVYKGIVNGALIEGAFDDRSRADLEKNIYFCFIGSLQKKEQKFLHSRDSSGKPGG